ncbi:hypothetical protein KY330_04810 [Candidatus Woesearchaeota archaeon]|nr:hypothetical protein [Candidatus Woesearchaeota archaeon]
MNKKAALQLSVTAIVVMVIAFVVLGLALTFTKDIFQRAQEKLPGAFDLTELEAEPTADNPVTMESPLSIKRGTEKTIGVGVYNTGENEINAKIDVVSCKKGTTIVSGETLPTFTSFAQPISASDAKGFEVIVQENELSAGTYVCILAVFNADKDLIVDDTTGTIKYGDAGMASSDVYESEQFFLKITT